MGGHRPPWRYGRVTPHPDQGRVIREARLARGISLIELAYLLGCSEDMVLHYQGGRYTPSAKMHSKLEAVLGVKVPMPKMLPSLTASQ